MGKGRVCSSELGMFLFDILMAEARKHRRRITCEILTPKWQRLTNQSPETSSITVPHASDMFNVMVFIIQAAEWYPQFPSDWEQARGTET